MKIGIVLGSIREGRAGEAVANWVAESAAGREGVDYQVVDLKTFDLPLFTSATPPAAAAKKYDNAEVQRWSVAVDACDAYVFVTPEYNHSVPGAFKNAVDSLGAEWSGKPVAFVSYGADGAIRAVEHWRQILANFSMYDIRAQVPLGLFTDFDASGLAPIERRAGELELLFTQLEAATQR